MSRRDLVSVVREIQTGVTEKVLPTLSAGYFVEYGGQFEAQQEANLRLLVMGFVAVSGVFLLLLKCLGSWCRRAGDGEYPVGRDRRGAGALAHAMAHGRGMNAAPFWQWPHVWIQATSLSVAHSVGFITLIGIVNRNGIMMISHYIHLMQFEGEHFDEKMIIRGSLERLAPVLMTG